jgi:hypothetical protein
MDEEVLVATGGTVDMSTFSSDSIKAANRKHDEVIKKDTIKYEKLYNISSVVEQWFQKHVHGVHGLDTAVYNRLHAAKEELKQILGDLQ